MTLSIIIGLSILEVVIRLKNSDQQVYDIEMWRYSNTLKRRSPNAILGHEHVPGTTAVLQNVDIRINEQGLRGGPVPIPKTGQRRILFLGSSITLGWGVEEKDTLTFRLDQRMKDSGQNAVIFNAGIGNYNTVRYVERYVTELRVLKPTDIVVQYFVNDAEVLKAGGGNLLLRNSQLAVTMWIVGQRLFNSGTEDSLVEHYRSVYRPDSAGYKMTVSALTRLAKSAEADGIRLYLAITPDVHNLVSYKLGFVHTTISKLASTLGYRVIDLLPALKGVPPEKIWSLQGDPHPNALGHKLMAEAIYPALGPTK
jgi:lysophospholipase L1-like esterase